MRFTIRDVMWLTLVVAILAGWGIDHARQVAWQAQVKEAIQSTGMVLHFFNGRPILVYPD